MDSMPPSVERWQRKRSLGEFGCKSGEEQIAKGEQRLKKKARSEDRASASRLKKRLQDAAADRANHADQAGAHHEQRAGLGNRVVAEAGDQAVARGVNRAALPQSTPNGQYTRWKRAVAVHIVVDVDGSAEMPLPTTSSSRLPPARVIGERPCSK